MLTAKQIDQYRRDGYVIPDFVLPTETIDTIKEHHQRFVECYPQFVDYCPAVLAYDLGFLNYARQPEILDMVEQLLGPNIALWNSSFFAKPERKGQQTPWHQDGEYWPIRPLATCTVWIAVDNSTTQNGCLQVIPGSHRDRQLKKHVANLDPNLNLPLELDASEFEEAEAIELVLEAGQISLHDVYLFHGSAVNTSDLPRRGMTLRFMPTSSVYDRSIVAKSGRQGRLSMTERSLFLMRGEDVSSQNDFLLRH
ncbi:phytanoyl-CoA dioxygenase family protein [Candidatus Poribacteria bacterium]|nr:phytanoyl-CoA dioxygenase family protein [Candidatus Poribacteria bacterium]